MKTINQRLLFFILLINTIGFAQKYTKTDTSELSKNWNETTFYASKTFTENITEIPSFSTLKKNLELGSSTKEIEDQEMVTIFAMTNNAYEKLQGVNDSVFDIVPITNRIAIIKYHVIPGRVDKRSIKKAIQYKGGIAYFMTLQGVKLGIKEENSQLFLVDSFGNTSVISATDFYHKNGFFHIVEGYVLPTSDL
ncbi:MAG: fasciclin domain-containing protein [Flavobacteriaceae bacterium]|nr:fasciclin domain-containing protein [Flavobacteriaceae bacterium]